MRKSKFANAQKGFFACTIVAVLTMAAIANIAINFSGLQSAYAADDNNWYVGKGAKSNMYVTYKIQHQDTNQGRPFLMTIYFKEFNNTAHYWIAPVFVVDQGKVINGTFHLSDLDLTALGSSNIPTQMAPYRSAYQNSLAWLAAFVPKPGQALNAPYWGKIASIGGSPIAPGSTAQVTVPAGKFDTSLISYHKGVDNNIWINKDLPYPVKASTFADVTTGNPPIQYAFELQAIGQGQPNIPKSQQQIPKPGLTVQTARGTYIMQLFWEPDPIQAGKDTKFAVLFQTAAKNIATQVSYSFKVTDSNGTVIKDLKDQKAPDGNGTQVIKFSKDGPAQIQVSVDAVAGNPMGDFVESANFGIVVSPAVVPEFPITVTTMLMTVIIGLVVIFTRLKSSNTMGNSKLFGNQ